MAKKEKSKAPSLEQVFKAFGRGRRKTDKLDLTGFKKKQLKVIAEFLAAGQGKKTRKNYYSLLKMNRASQRESQKYLKQSKTEQLSKLPNKAAFQEVLESMIGRRAETGNDFALFFIDINAFKNFNDTHGHAEGDRAIQLLAEKLKSVTRQGSDFVSHWGGDEFAVIAGDVSADEAEKINSKLKQSFPIAIEVGIQSVVLDCSFGFVSTQNLYSHCDRLSDDEKLLLQPAISAAVDILNNRNSSKDEISQVAETLVKLSDTDMYHNKNPDGLSAEERGVRGNVRQLRKD